MAPRKKVRAGDNGQRSAVADLPIEVPISDGTASNANQPALPTSPTPPEEASTTTAGVPTSAADDSKEKTSVFSEVWSAKDPNACKAAVVNEIEGLINDSGLAKQYDLIFLYDEHDSITRPTVDQIYPSLPAPKTRDILLVLHSYGGNIEPAYLISKCCKACANKFCVVVPRVAKSAATLISLGADEIHMGLVSELGPIDPQVGKYPALSLRSALQHITSLVEEHPSSGQMYSSYLSSQLDLRDLGYLERVSESAVQYAERLLLGKNVDSERSPANIAHKLVYEYKDHSFVIDRDEARSILGDKRVLFDTPEYRLASAMQSVLGTIDFIYAYRHKKKFKIIGSLARGLQLWDIEE